MYMYVYYIDCVYTVLANPMYLSCVHVANHGTSTPAQVGGTPPLQLSACMCAGRTFQLVCVCVCVMKCVLCQLSACMHMFGCSQPCTCSIEQDPCRTCLHACVQDIPFQLVCK